MTSVHQDNKHTHTIKYIKIKSSTLQLKHTTQTPSTTPTTPTMANANSPPRVRLILPPLLTFGLELELDFAIPKHLYFTWLDTFPTLSYSPPSSPLTPRSPRAVWLRQRYLADRLRGHRDQAASPGPQGGSHGGDRGDDEDTEMTDVLTPLPGQDVVKKVLKSSRLLGDVVSGYSPGLPTPRAGNRRRRDDDDDDDDPVDRTKRVRRESNSTMVSMTNSTDSRSHTLRAKLLMYLLAYLNRQLPGQRGRSMLGPVSFATPKIASSDDWHLTYDDSLFPSRNDFKDVLGPGITYEETRDAYRVVGAELVSKVMDFADEPRWRGVLQEIQNDLVLAQGRPHGVWFTRQEHLHVHVALADEPITLDVAKTLLVLYGLFEGQIERWLKLQQRDSEWCVRLRLGMETLRTRIVQTGPLAGVEVEALPVKRYTPGEFVDRLYGAATFEDLRTEASGREGGEKIPDGTGLPYDHVPIRNWVTVHVSMPRDNKPCTFEFRHHHGTIDQEEIRWWVKFCGAMVRHAYFLVRKGMKLTDARPLVPGRQGYVARYADQDLLEVLNFPADGRAHFRAQAKKYEDVDFDAMREIERQLIETRILRRSNGEETGRVMDNAIMLELW